MRTSHYKLELFSEPSPVKNSQLQPKALLVGDRSLGLFLPVQQHPLPAALKPGPKQTGIPS